MIFAIITLIICIKLTALVFKICGKLLGLCFGFVGIILIGAIATGILSLLYLALPILIIVGLITAIKAIV